MTKLELKHLAPYLPYNVKGRFKWGGIDLITLPLSHPIGILKSPLTYQEYKLILRPLSDLTKEIEVNGDKFVPIDELKSTLFENDCDAYKEWYEHFDDMGKWTVWVQAPFEIVQLLLEWHFDVFGLIEAGLAIDINTL